MPPRSEVLGHGSIGRQKALGMSRGLEPLHAILPLARRPMGVLTPVVEIATLAMFHTGQYVALGRAIAFELIRDDHTRHVLQSLEQLAEKLLRCPLIAATLHQDVEHVIVLVDSSPQVMPLTMNGEKHLIQVPLVTRPGSSAPQLIGIVLPELATPLAEGVSQVLICYPL